MDDERGPRESLRMILAPNHEVLQASSGAEALEILGTQHVDLVTLDLNMPGMKGQDLMRTIRSEYPQVEIIIITGCGSLESATEGIRSGICDYLQKPFDVVQVTASVAGGHLVRLQSSLRDASTKALIAQLVGIAVGVLAREPGAAVVIGSGGAHIATRSLLRFSRSQEQSADQAGIRLLDRTGQSARGLLEFLRYLSQQELLSSARQDRYLLTHPMSRDRVLFMENHVARSPNSNRPFSAEIHRMQKRMIAKLNGFLDPPATTLNRYKADDRSIEARYARAVAQYRIPDMVNALKTIDGLIAEAPRDPYFRELKGQMLFENGRLEEALPEWLAAVNLLPDSALLRVSLAQVQIELERTDLLAPALSHLKHAFRTGSDSALAWRLLATVHGRLGQRGLLALSLAEYNLRIGRRKDAQGQASRAMRILKRSSPAWLRAQDILNQTQRRN